jgi:hypothetical protein
MVQSAVACVAGRAPSEAAASALAGRHHPHVVANATQSGSRDEREGSRQRRDDIGEFKIVVAR